MRPTAIRLDQTLVQNHTRTFGQMAYESVAPYRQMGEMVRYPEPLPYIPERVRMLGQFPIPDGNHCPTFLYNYLTDTPPFSQPAQGNPVLVAELRKREQASLLYAILQGQGTTENLSKLQQHDPTLIPTIELDGRHPLPMHAAFDASCDMDDLGSVMHLSHGFEAVGCELRGLSLKFGHNPVNLANTAIARGIATSRTLQMVELHTDPANVPAQLVALQAVGVNSAVEQLSIQGEVTEEHRSGLLAALSNANLQHVVLRAQSEASCLQLLDSASAANGQALNLKIDWQVPTYWHQPGTKAASEAKWNAAVCCLAEAGRVQNLFVPREVLTGLSTATIQLAATHGMQIYAN